MKAIQKTRIILAMLLASLFMPPIVMAAKPQPLNIQVLGLYRDKAAVKINGEQHLLKIGEATENGVVLVRSNAKRAVIEVNGVQKTYTLGNAPVSTELSTPTKKVVRIPSQNGMYLTQGLINGRSVDFLVDTGASVIAMSRVAANRLQIPFRETGEPMKISTAAALKDAWQVRLGSVTVGGITVNQVDATVIDTEHDQPVLLGMSFLSRIKFTQQEGIVVLEAKAAQ